MLKVDLHIGNRLLMLIDKREFSISIQLGIMMDSSRELKPSVRKLLKSMKIEMIESSIDLLSSTSLLKTLLIKIILIWLMNLLIIILDLLPFRKWPRSLKEIHIFLLIYKYRKWLLILSSKKSLSIFTWIKVIFILLSKSIIGLLFKVLNLMK